MDSSAPTSKPRSTVHIEEIVEEASKETSTQGFPADGKSDSIGVRPMGLSIQLPSEQPLGEERLAVKASPIFDNRVSTHLQRLFIGVAIVALAVLVAFQIGLVAGVILGIGLLAFTALLEFRQSQTRPINENESSEAKLS